MQKKMLVNFKFTEAFPRNIIVLHHTYNSGLTGLTGYILAYSMFGFIWPTKTGSCSKTKNNGWFPSRQFL
jgi:hypothetical protein